MSFLVIVHVPYMPVTEAGDKEEREHKPDEEKAEVELSVHTVADEDDNDEAENPKGDQNENCDKKDTENPSAASVDGLMEPTDETTDATVEPIVDKTTGEETDKEIKDEDRVEKGEVVVTDKEAKIEDTSKEVQVKEVKDVEVKDEDNSKEENNSDGTETTKTDDLEEETEKSKTPGTDGDLEEETEKSKTPGTDGDLEEKTEKSKTPGTIGDLEEETEKGKAAGTDGDNIEDRIEDKQEEDSAAEENRKHHRVPLTPLFRKIAIHMRVEQELRTIGVDNVDIEIVGYGMYRKFSFVQEDSQKCEQILNRLRGVGVGITAGSTMSVFPSSLHESVTGKVTGVDDDSPGNINKNEEVDQKESQFKKSVKSRLLVAQVVVSVRDNAEFTFDYLLLLLLASTIACIGLVENSSVVLVASMLISPLMGPILAATFGQVIKKKDLRNLGLKSEMKGLALCLIVGFAFGLVSGGVGLYGAIWGSTDSWPTTEMRSRGMMRSLWVGVMIALPSGAGVAISVLGGNAGSLVGVAISASLLPPACNAGMLWAYCLLAAIKPPAVEGVSAAATMIVTVMTTQPPSTLSPVNASDLPNTTSTVPLSPTTSTMTSLRSPGNCLPLVNNTYEEVYFCNVAQEAALLGLVSLMLTLINICCIIVMGIIVLKIKEVAPHTAGVTTGVDTFWKEHVHVARGYYTTSKGQSSISLGKTFLEEYKKLKANARDLKKKKDKTGDESSGSGATSGDESDDQHMDALKMHVILQDVENSPDCQTVCSKLPNVPVKKVSEDLNTEYNEAAEYLCNSLARNPGVYLADRPITDKQFQKVYQTIHHLPSTARPGITQLRDTFKTRKSMFIESTTLDFINDTNNKMPGQSKSFLGLSKPRSMLFNRRKQKVKFQVTKVEEEQQLV